MGDSVSGNHSVNPMPRLRNPGLTLRLIELEITSIAFQSRSACTINVLLTFRGIKNLKPSDRIQPQLDRGQ